MSCPIFWNKPEKLDRHTANPRKRHGTAAAAPSRPTSASAGPNLAIVVVGFCWSSSIETTA